MRRQPWAMAAVVTLTMLEPLTSNGQPTGAVLTAITTTIEDGATVVTLESDGPLPEPAPEVLDGPPRIFFDLSGVRPRRQGATLGAGLVRRTRVALRSTNPNVTRVVLDLPRLEGYRVERQPGRIRVLVGVGPTPTATAPPASSAAPTVAVPVPAPTDTTTETAPQKFTLPPRVLSPDKPVPYVPPPSTPALRPPPNDAPPAPRPTKEEPTVATRNPVSLPSLSPPPSLPPVEADVYRAQLAASLGRLVKMRHLLRAIDAREPVGIDALSAAAIEFRDIRRALDRVEPSSVVRPTHQSLIASCTLAGMAVTLRMEAAVDPDREMNAASAAAGALMLFDRVCAAVRCALPPE